MKFQRLHLPFNGTLQRIKISPSNGMKRGLSSCLWSQRSLGEHTIVDRYDRIPPSYENCQRSLPRHKILSVREATAAARHFNSS